MIQFRGMDYYEIGALVVPSKALLDFMDGALADKFPPGAIFTVEAAHVDNHYSIVVAKRFLEKVTEWQHAVPEWFDLAVPAKRKVFRA